MCKQVAIMACNSHYHSSLMTITWRVSHLFPKYKINHTPNNLRLCSTCSLIILSQHYLPKCDGKVVGAKCDSA
jgi:hypothetical protein